MTDLVPPTTLKSWALPLATLALAILLQFGGIVWFAKGLQASQDNLERRIVLMETTNPAVSQAATERRLTTLEGDAKDFRAALVTILDKISLGNEKLARVEGILGTLADRAQRPGATR